MTCFVKRGKSASSGSTKFRALRHDFELDEKDATASTKLENLLEAFDHGDAHPNSRGQRPTFR